MTTPAATLGALSTQVAAQSVNKIPSAYVRLNAIEHAVVSTYSIMDAAGSIRMGAGLIDSAANTAYVIAANTNHMLSEASSPEARAVLLRLLRPTDSEGVIGEVRDLFGKLRDDRARHGLTDDIDDFCASYMIKLNRAVDRLAENVRLSDLIAKNHPVNDPLIRRVSAWCDQVFSGQIDQLGDDPLFKALSALHRMEITRDIPFTLERHRQILSDLREQGYPSPEDNIFGPARAATLRACELLLGTVENEVISSRSFRHPPHLIAAAESLLSNFKGYRVFAWEDFYRRALKNYLRTAQRENAEISSPDLALSLRTDHKSA